MEITTVSAEFGGQTLTIETGRMARLAGGAVTVRYGDTVVLGTANRSDPRPGLDFFPLTIEFEERMYAAGKIPGGYIKREGKAPLSPETRIRVFLSTPIFLSRATTSPTSWSRRVTIAAKFLACSVHSFLSA